MVFIILHLSLGSVGVILWFQEWPLGLEHPMASASAEWMAILAGAGWGILSSFSFHLASPLCCTSSPGSLGIQLRVFPEDKPKEDYTQKV